MKFQRTDLDTWGRGDLFRYYIQNMRIVMSLTVETDVTPRVRHCREKGPKFYPVMIWAVSKAVNAHDEFKYRWDGEGRPFCTISPPARLAGRTRFLHTKHIGSSRAFHIRPVSYGGIPNRKDTDQCRSNFKI